ncbi:NB-ARC domain-containing protein, partial [Moorena sp. SIO3I6]|uniref:NB-ARC domain-containing protein n=1 Tax=Moorena sp. SIO3I6 TaxID=2607831 RepID=UPI0013FBB298
MNSEELNAIFWRILGGNQTNSDIAALRDVLISTGNQYVVQSGSGNINIGQGHDINIENYTFNLPEAEIIRKFLEKLTTIPHNLARVRSGVVNFVGREKQLKDLHQQLQEKERIAITAVVSGMAGVGKTELAIQYAQHQKQQSTYPAGICWIQVQESNPGLQLLSFAKSQLNLNPRKDLELLDQLDHCWSQWPPLDGDVLIILDDVRNYEEIKGYLPPQESRFKVLITTRKYWLSESFEQLRLEVLDEQAALELLTSFIGKSRLEKEPVAASQLCNDLGYLPLGLELVARFLKRRSHW